MVISLNREEGEAYQQGRNVKNATLLHCYIVKIWYEAWQLQFSVLKGTTMSSYSESWKEHCDFPNMV